MAGRSAPSKTTSMPDFPWIARQSCSSKWKASAEIIRYCLEVGGALTGEHGVGMEKSELMPLVFSDADFNLMRRVHDAFNPDCSLNPGKIFPLNKGCGEIRVRKQPVEAASLP